MTAESLADGVVAALAESLPVLLTRLDAQAEASAGDWSALRVTPLQEAALTVFPAVEVVVRSEQVVGYDHDADEDLLLVQYTVRVYATCRGGSYDETDRARKRLVAALRELLLGEATPGEAQPSTLRASYSEIDRDRNQRTLAAGYVELNLRVLEPAVTPVVWPPVPGALVHVHPIVEHL